MTKLYGSLEAGGTKFVCAVGDEQFQVVEKTQFPTTTPYETIERIGHPVPQGVGPADSLLRRNLGGSHPARTSQECVSARPSDPAIPGRWTASEMPFRIP